MDQSIAAYAIAGISCLIPIVMWGYLVSSLQDRSEGFATKKFAAGLVGGGISVAPILAFDLYRNDLQNSEGLFGFFAKGSLNFAGMGLDLAIPIAGVLITAGAYAFLAKGKQSKGFLDSFFRISLPNFLVASALLALVVAILWFLGMGGRSISVNVPIQNVVIANLLGIVAYYFFVGYIEESSKHAHALVQREDGSDTKAFVIVSLFATLGFAFVENVMYLVALLTSNESGFFSLLTSRSVMAVIVHALTAAIFANAFGKAISRKGERPGAFKKSVIIGMALSIVAHAVFDIGATYGNGIVIISYFFLSYIYVTRIFAVDSEGSSEYRTAS